MKYAGMPMGMRLLFDNSFRAMLYDALWYGKVKAIPEFEKGDHFRMNVLSCAFLSFACVLIEEVKDIPYVQTWQQVFEKRGNLSLTRLVGSLITALVIVVL